MVQHRRPTRVIVYGADGARWRAALSPQAGIWAGLPGVDEVVLADGVGALLRDGLTTGLHSIVLPCRKRALRRFPRLWWSLAPSRSAHDTCADKWRFDRFMRKAGFAALLPATWRGAEAARFPCVVKRFDKDGSHGVRVIDSVAHLSETLAQPPFRRRPLLFQELVEGFVDHATHCVAVDGRIVWQVSYAYDIDPVTRVQTIDSYAGRRRFETPPEVLETFERIFVALRYSGPVSVDWRPRGGGVVLFEINPRFGGSLMLEANHDDLRAGLTAVIQHARPPRWFG